MCSDVCMCSWNLVARAKLRGKKTTKNKCSTAASLDNCDQECKSYIFVCGMDSTEDEQSPSETAETETGGLAKPGIELSTEVDVENNGLYVTNLCLSIPVVLLALADNLPDFASFLSVHNFPSSFEYTMISFLIEEPSPKKGVDFVDKAANPSASEDLGLNFPIYFYFSHSQILWNFPLHHL